MSAYYQVPVVFTVRDTLGDGEEALAEALARYLRDALDHAARCSRSFDGVRAELRRPEGGASYGDDLRVGGQVLDQFWTPEHPDACGGRSHGEPGLVVWESRLRHVADALGPWAALIGEVGSNGLFRGEKAERARRDSEEAQDLVERIKTFLEKVGEQKEEQSGESAGQE